MIQLIRCVTWRTALATSGPSRYKDDQVRVVGLSLLEDHKIIALTNAHTDRFEHRGLVIDPDDGYFSDDSMKTSPHVLFLGI
jgi:hypothetical protein